MHAIEPRSANLLIVEDDRISATIIERALGREGYGCATAPDGETALALFAQGHRYDAVILDRCMPGMDGIQVLQHMKRTPGLWDVPVIMATAMDTQEDMWEGVRNGAFYYLLKPLNLDLLTRIVAAAVGEAMTRKRLWAEMETVRSAIGLIHHGTFHYQTLSQCEELAALLATSCPEPRRTSVGLFELMLNALEHGNLGIGYDEKTALIDDHRWAEEMHRRQRLPENQDKRVTVSVARTREKVRFKIQDQGEGFPWRDYQEMAPDRLFDNHGRGILLARWETFDRVEYQGPGNRVFMEISRPAPLGESA